MAISMTNSRYYSERFRASGPRAGQPQPESDSNSCRTGDSDHPRAGVEDPVSLDKLVALGQSRTHGRLVLLSVTGSIDGVSRDRRAGDASGRGKEVAQP